MKNYFLFASVLVNACLDEHVRQLPMFVLRLVRRLQIAEQIQSVVFVQHHLSTLALMARVKLSKAISCIVNANLEWIVILRLHLLQHQDVLMFPEPRKFLIYFFLIFFFSPISVCFFFNFSDLFRQILLFLVIFLIQMQKQLHPQLPPLQQTHRRQRHCQFQINRHLFLQRRNQPRH